MNLMNNLPSFYNASDVVVDIENAIGIEGEELKQATQDLFNQLFIDTATWGLRYWERYLNIQTDISKPYDYRRTVIKSKLRGSGTTTVAMIKNVAESFSNGTVDVIENSSNYSFTIKFVGTLGVPPNLEDFKKVIEEIKPAHLAVNYEFTYLTWSEFDNYNKTWDEWDSLNLTWDMLEIYIP